MSVQSPNDDGQRPRQKSRPSAASTGSGAGILRSWSLASGEPKLQWEVSLSANIEASPAVWNGRIYVGSRSGFFYAVGNE